MIRHLVYYGVFIAISALIHYVVIRPPFGPLAPKTDPKEAIQAMMEIAAIAKEVEHLEKALETPPAPPASEPPPPVEAKAEQESEPEPEAPAEEPAPPPAPPPPVRRSEPADEVAEPDIKRYIPLVALGVIFVMAVGVLIALFVGV